MLSKMPYIFIIILLLTCSILTIRYNNLVEKYDTLYKNHVVMSQELTNANTEIYRLKDLSKSYEILKNTTEEKDDEFTEEFNVIKKSETSWSDTPIPDSYIKLLNKGRTDTHSTGF